jgi:hypothetical protein
MSSALVPSIAWSQGQLGEPVLMRGSTSVPVANTWYVDEAGNFVLMSEAQLKAVELAQLPTPQVPLQSLTETASSSMQIPPEMLQQVMAYSAAMGGVAGGGLVGSLALSSGILRGDDGVDGTDGIDGTDGQDGQSAYDIWLSAGNSGSEQDFLDSLKGATGPQGPIGATGANGINGADGAAGADGSDGLDGSSAYQIWLSAGNTGTEQDFLNSLVGAAGATGDAGADGKSAYQIWIDAGNTRTYQTFLDSLVGATGATGAAGQDGTDGSDGASAYQVWLDLGNTGSEQDFIDSLSGPTGATGAAGQDGADGSDGVDGNNHPSIFGGSAAIVSVSENSTAVFYTASATDPDAGDTPTFTKGTAGGDEGLFTLTSDGKLSFTSAADYENPNSSGGGNTYLLRIVASDGRGGTDTQDVTVNVTDITENSTLELNESDGATFNILQGNTYLFDAFDSEGDTITYSLISNGHGSGVTLNSQTGLLSVASSVAAGSADVTIRASSTNPDQTSETDTETYTINVQDITPPTLTITADDDTLTPSSTTNLTFAFSEPVIGFDASDIALSGNGQITGFSGSGDTYQATYIAFSSSDLDDVSVAAASYSDLSGTLNAAGSEAQILVGGLNETYEQGALPGGSNTIQGTSYRDQIELFANAIDTGSILEILLEDGDDSLTIERQTGTVIVEGADGNKTLILGQLFGPAYITNENGSNTYTFDDGANEINIQDGEGDTDFIFGEQAHGINIMTGSGEKHFSFGVGAANSGNVKITTYGEKNSFEFGNIAGVGSASNPKIEINSFDSDDYYFFGNGYGRDGARIVINSGSGDKYFEFGDRQSNRSQGTLDIDIGNGNHDFQFGYTNSSSGNPPQDRININIGSGNSNFTFASAEDVNITSGNGSTYIAIDRTAERIDVNLGQGPDVIVMDSVASSSIDLGLDSDADSIYIGGSFDLEVINYVLFVDDKINLFDHTGLTGVDDGTDIIFYQSGNQLTFEGLGGVGGSTDPLDYFM